MSTRSRVTKSIKTKEKPDTSRCYVAAIWHNTFYVLRGNDIQEGRDPEFNTKEKLWLTAIQLKDTCQNNVSFNYISGYYGDMRPPRGMRADKKSYVERSLQAMKEPRDGVFILLDEFPGVITPRGFVFTKMDGDFVHIDIICCEDNYGQVMLSYFLNFFDTLQIDVSLDSLASVLLYYPKFDFKFREDCESPIHELHPDLVQRMKMYFKTDPPSNPKNNDEAYVNNEWMEAMTDLQRHGLNVDKGGPCHNTNLSKEEIIINNCAQDGFRMVRCKAPKKPSPKPSPKPTSPKHKASPEVLTDYSPEVRTVPREFRESTVRAPSPERESGAARRFPILDDEEEVDPEIAKRTLQTRIARMESGIRKASKPREPSQTSRAASLAAASLMASGASTLDIRLARVKAARKAAKASR